MGSSTADRRHMVFAGATLAIFMASIEATIVATAMPTIVADLGGLQLFAWVFGVYFFAQALTIPVYGRLSDVYGRKRMLFIAIALFLTSSIACAFSRSMGFLIAFRALQGLGAGGIQPVASTIIGDIYSPAERARYQGYLSSTWGISAVAGPMIGAFLLVRFTWSAIFWINVPIGIVCVLLFAWFYHEQAHSRGNRPEYVGALIASFASSTVKLWRIRLIALSNAGCFLIGSTVMSVSAFLPTYIQGPMGRSALIAGFAVGANSFFWTVGSIVSGRVMLRSSYRFSALVGTCALLGGIAMLIALNPARGPWWAGVACAATGLGFGMVNLTFLISTQSAVGREQRGTATASNMFMRNFGQTVGTGVLGAVFNLSLRTRTPGAIAVAVHNVYLVAGLFALGVLALTLVFPRGLNPTQAAPERA